MTSATPAQRPRVLQITVDGYKNLRLVRLDWSTVNVLFGANASGKTNLLECLALLFGTDRTLALAGRRALLPAPAALQCVAEVAARQLPYPPEVARRLRDAVPPLAERAERDLAWWASLGATAGATFAGALVDAGLPAPLVETLAAAAKRPTVRYSLDRMDAFAERARSFGRTLTLPAATAAALRAASPAGLPQEFAPLLDEPAAADDQHRGVLTLPPGSQGPARLEWLAAARTSDEVHADLAAAFDQALPPARALADDIAFLLLPDDDTEPEGSWWLHEVGAAAASRELSMTTRGATSVTSIGANDAEWSIATAGREAATTLDPNFLDSLSSGERRWVDEALATLARTLDDHGRRCAWQHFFWNSGEDAFWKHLEAQLDHGGDPGATGILARVADELPQISRDQEYVDADTLTEVAALLDRHLWAEATSWLARDAVLAEMTIALLAASADALAEPGLTIRVFDEPEAHLHPAAQRVIRDALRSLGNAGDDIVIASHSPYLLDVPDWNYLKMSAGRLRPLKPRDLQASREFARELGLTTGELLVNTRLVLVVEGKHDRVFLDALDGDRLRHARPPVLPIHGTDNARALLDSEFWRNYASVPFAVMFDNARLERVDDRTILDDDLTHEEQTFRRLGRELTRPWHRIGLERPDITAYLHPSLFESHPRFPGWATVIDDFNRYRGRRGFKKLLAVYGVDLKATAAVAELAAAMRARGLHPPDDMERNIGAVCAWAATGTDSASAALGQPG